MENREDRVVDRKDESDESYLLDVLEAERDELKDYIEDRGEGQVADEIMRRYQLVCSILAQSGWSIEEDLDP